jgi:hypothetical protein
MCPSRQGSERASAALPTPANPGKWKQSHTGIRASFAFEEHHLSIKVLRHEDQQLTQCGDTPPALVSGKKVRLVRARPAQLARQPVRRERGAARRGTGTFLGIVRLLSSDRFLSAFIMGWGGYCRTKSLTSSSEGYGREGGGRDETRGRGADPIPAPPDLASRKPDGWRRQIRRGADYHHAALRRMA